MSCLTIFLDEVVLYKPKDGSMERPAPDSCCIPSMLLRIARTPLEDRALENGVQEGYSCSYDLEVVAGLYKKISKTWKKDDWNNNDLQVGCFITNNFPCIDGETGG